MPGSSRDSRRLLVPARWRSVRSVERVFRCLPDLSDLGEGNPVDQHSQASTRLLSFSITSWASDSTHSLTHTGPVGACPCLSPIGGVLIWSLMTQLYKPLRPWKTSCTRRLHNFSVSFYLFVPARYSVSSRMSHVSCGAFRTVSVITQLLPERQNLALGDMKVEGAVSKKKKKIMSLLNNSLSCESGQCDCLFELVCWHNVQGMEGIHSVYVIFVGKGVIMAVQSVCSLLPGWSLWSVTSVQFNIAYGFFSS